MALRLKDRLLEQPIVYRTWQAPFAGRKFDVVLRHNDMSRVWKVLDVGCGPGTNADVFADMDYVGVDVNPKYIEEAQRRHPGRFLVADATQLDPSTLGTFDFVLVNSFLHHVTDEDAARILERVAPVISADGHVHVLDLVLPASTSAARLLAKLDRGDYPRPLERWRELFRAAYDEVAFEAYPLGVGRLALWQMVYFKGAPRGQADAAAGR